MGIAAFAVNIALVIMSDIHALLWVRGIKPLLPEKRMRIFHQLISLGLVIAIVSGAWLFSTVADYLLTVPAFYTKMLFVLALIVNSFVIGRHIQTAVSHTFADISARERRTLLFSGLASSTAWAGTFVSALFLGL